MAWNKIKMSCIDSSLQNKKGWWKVKTFQLSGWLQFGVFKMQFLSVLRQKKITLFKEKSHIENRQQFL